MKFIVLDTETENLNLSHLNRPWQVSWLLCDEKLIISKHNEYILWPNLNIPKEVQIMTGFNQEVYDKYARPPLDVYNDFYPYYKYPCVTHNGLGFDIHLIKTWFESIGKWEGFESMINRQFDTNCLSKMYLNKIPIDLPNLMASQFKMVNFVRRGLKTNLKFMCQHLNIEFDESKHHDASYDIEKTRELFLSLKYRLDF